MISLKIHQIAVESSKGAYHHLKRKIWSFKTNFLFFKIKIMKEQNQSGDYSQICDFSLNLIYYIRQQRIWWLKNFFS